MHDLGQILKLRKYLNLRNGNTNSSYLTQVCTFSEGTRTKLTVQAWHCEYWIKGGSVTVVSCGGNSVSVRGLGPYRDGLPAGGWMLIG